VSRAGGLVVGLTIAALAGPAFAGAWNQPKGKGQVILKLEHMTADRGFDPDGVLSDLPAQRRDTSIGAFVEYGLTDRLTVQFKGDWQSGEDAFVAFEGRGPIELGIRWQAWRDESAALSLYAGYATGGEGRNAGYAAPGEGDQDWEIRASLGRSFEAGWGPIPPRTFVEVQAARRMRQGLPDETRLDLTSGTHLGDDWMVLAQAFGGQTDDGVARWLSVEASVVRDFGNWSLQAGWRQTIAGRETPESSGPIVGLWRRF
jgi:protein XagA